MKRRYTGWPSSSASGTLTVPLSAGSPSSWLALVTPACIAYLHRSRLSLDMARCWRTNSGYPSSCRSAQTQQHLVITQGHYMLLCIPHAPRVIELHMTRDKDMKHLLGAF